MSSNSQKSESQCSNEKVVETSHVEEHSDQDEEEYCDLTDNVNYQVLSSIFETEKGETVSELLEKIEKNTRSIAMSQSKIAQAQINTAKATIRQATVIEKFVTLFLEAQIASETDNE